MIVQAKCLFRWWWIPAMVAALAACETASPEADLRQAARVVAHTLRHAGPAVEAEDFHPRTVPTHFVEWFFSPFGSAQWVPPSSMEFSKEELKMIRKSSIIPLLPETVTLVPRKPDPDKGRQVVLVPDDARGVIQLEGYSDPSQPLVMRVELSLLQTEDQPSTVFRNL